MKVEKPTLSSLRDMEHWITARDLAAGGKLSPQAMRNRVARLVAAGLAESKTVDGKPIAPREYRRTAAGVIALAAMEAAAAEPEPTTPQESSGNNPFEWRSYKQHVPSPSGFRVETLGGV